MGFLDKNDRVFDVVLTEDGIEALSKGRLQYSYFVVFDDLIDYNPIITNSSSYSSNDLQVEKEKQIEETPLLEAAVIKQRNTRKDLVSSLAPSCSLYDAADDYKVLPVFNILPSSSLSIEVQQQTTDGKYRYYRLKSSAVTFVSNITGDKQTNDTSFNVDVFISGSDGLKEADEIEMPGFSQFDDVITITFDPERSILRRR